MCEIINFKLKDYANDSPVSSCLNNPKGSGTKHEKNVIIPLIKILLINQNKSYILNWRLKGPSIVVEAFDKNLFECAKFLISNGAHCFIFNEEKENFLHLLYRKYSKEN